MGVFSKEGHPLVHPFGLIDMTSTADAPLHFTRPRTHTHTHTLCTFLNIEMTYTADAPLHFTRPQTHTHTLIERTPPPPGGFSIYYVPSSRTVSKRTPLEAPGTNSSRRVLLLTVLDEGI